MCALSLHIIELKLEKRALNEKFMKNQNDPKKILLKHWKDLNY